MKKVFFMAVCILLVFACSKKCDHQHGMDADEHRHGMAADELHEMAGMPVEGVDTGVVLRKVREEEIGMAAVCPVMGSRFQVKENTEAADYKGKTYYLCCAGCEEPFKNNPEKYIKK